MSTMIKKIINFTLKLVQKHVFGQNYIHRYITQHRYNHDPNTHANILSNPHYTHKHKRRHIHANRHMRELKCPRNTHEHKDKHKRYVHSQQKALTQDRKVVDARGWCVWVQWGNLLQGGTISGHGSAHMGTHRCACTLARVVIGAARLPALVLRADRPMFVRL